MFRLSVGIVLISIAAISAKLFVDVSQERTKNGLEDNGSCCQQLMACTANITSFESQLEDIITKWQSELRIQRIAVQDLENKIARHKRVNTTRIVGSCEEALRGGNEKAGVFLLNLPNTGLEPFEVYCSIDPNDGSPWMIVQRRFDGSIDFYRGWFDYKHGFGEVAGEFWIGLAKLHAITTTERYELWIHMEDFEGQKRYAKYDSFAVGDEQSFYSLKILGKYRGDAGDGLTIHQGNKFTTKDSDNDNYDPDNCAVIYTGAWWYRSCHNSNLNGRYLYGKNSPEDEGEGVEWYDWRPHYSLKSVHMAIRPIK